MLATDFQKWHKVCLESPEVCTPSGILANTVCLNIYYRTENDIIDEVAVGCKYDVILLLLQLETIGIAIEVQKERKLPLLLPLVSTKKYIDIGIA